MNWKVIALGAVVVGLLALVYFYGFGTTFGRGIQGFQNPGSGEATFTMYYADWCPHCQVAKPAFEELVKKGAVETPSGKRCVVRMVNPEEQPELAKGKPIKGFPTFLLETADGQTLEYQGKRETDGYLQFINEKLGGGI